jgi:hypothetical protein
VLCIQRGTGRPTNHFHKLRRPQRSQNQRNTPPRNLDKRVFRNFLDRAQPCLPKPLHQNFYETDTADFTNCAGNYQNLLAFVPAFAVQYFFDLLFPVPHESKSGIYSFSFARTCSQRTFNPDFAVNFRAPINLAGNATHRNPRGHLRKSDDKEIHEGVSGRVSGGGRFKVN